MAGERIGGAVGSRGGVSPPVRRVAGSPKRPISRLINLAMAFPADLTTRHHQSRFDGR
jgi:hypothetical protein